MMQRKIYNSFIEWKQKNIQEPIMLIGARQTGKTYILDYFCKNEYKDYLYVNFDTIEKYEQFFEDTLNPKEIIKKLEMYFERKIDPAKTIIFFDEIQKSERAIHALKYFCESEINYRIVTAGSLLGVKIQRFESSFPVGKVSFMKMYPLDFSEFLLATGNMQLHAHIAECYTKNEKMLDIFHDKAMKLYIDYLYVGGMPQAVKNYIQNDGNIVHVNRAIHNDIIVAYMADMAKYAQTSEAVKITTIYASMPEQLAKSNKKFIYKVADKKARKDSHSSSIDWLIQSGLLLIAKNIKVPETPLKAYEMENHFKLYMSDPGLLSALCGLGPADFFNNNIHTFKGAISENFVASTFVANNLPLNFWKSGATSEVDFILNIQGDIIPIEVKSAQHTQSKSLNVYMEKYKPKYAIRISGKNFGFHNNIKSVPMYAAYMIGT